MEVGREAGEGVLLPEKCNEDLSGQCEAGQAQEARSHHGQGRVRLDRIHNQEDDSYAGKTITIIIYLDESGFICLLRSKETYNV